MYSFVCVLQFTAIVALRYHDEKQHDRQVHTGSMLQQYTFELRDSLRVMRMQTSCSGNCFQGVPNPFLHGMCTTSGCVRLRCTATVNLSLEAEDIDHGVFRHNIFTGSDLQQYTWELQAVSSVWCPDWMLWQLFLGSPPLLPCHGPLIWMCTAVYCHCSHCYHDGNIMIDKSTLAMYYSSGM